MYFLTRQFWLAAAVASALTLSSPLVAQTIEKGPVRTVLALGRVTSVIETPVYFKLSRVTIPAAATVVYRGDHSMIYLLSSALTVAEANDKRALQHGEGTYLRPSIELTLQAGAGAVAELLQYQLLRVPYSATPAMNAPASAVELHQMNIPANALRPARMSSA